MEVRSIHTYVALYKFLPQEKNDLELQLVKFLSLLFVCVSFVVNIVQFREMRKCVPGQNFTDIHPPSASPAG